MLKLAEVKGQRRGREPQPLADVPRCKPLGSGLHKQPEDIQTRLVTERDKGGDGFMFFHISNMVEMLNMSRPTSRPKINAGVEVRAAAIKKPAGGGLQVAPKWALRDGRNTPDLPFGAAP